MAATGLILVLGQTGVGKSTFINEAAGNPVARVSDDLDSVKGTSEISQFEVKLQSSETSPIMLVDTPGFNDTWLKDVEILDMIITWLQSEQRTAGKNPVVVHGIVYLYGLQSHPLRPGVEMVTPDCLSDAKLAKNVCLATVGWTGIDSPKDLIPRETILKTDSWDSMIQNGSNIMRFERGQISARKILESITMTNPIPLEMFVKEIQAIRRRMPSPKANSHGRLEGFFSFLFGRRK